MSHDVVRRPTTPARVLVLDGEHASDRPDTLVTEEPMEIRLHGPGETPQALAVTMRTPGHDFELAVGFAFTEGLLRGFDELDTVAYCLQPAEPGAPSDAPLTQEYNIVTIALRRPVSLDVSPRRFVANASCGLCGKATIDDIEVRCEPLPDGPVVARSVLTSLPKLLRDAQTVFDATGGLHASALFTTDGELTLLREDIGRHNALDKVVGRTLLDDALPLSDHVLLVSGRVSFEIVQKSAVAGIPIVCAVSAPSSLAVDAARRLGQTLVGFVRGDRANVYTHPERVDLAS